MTRVLLLPGLRDSDPEHWQSYWERCSAEFFRVAQRDWNTPDRAEWVDTLERAVATSGPDVVLVGHSTACPLVAFWAATTTRTVHGALLVAPSDTEAASYPIGPTGWRPMPMARLPFPSIVVASTNDEYASMERAKKFATAWGSRLVNIGAAGHINAASALGHWSEGRKLLEELRS
jgi:predicted alpha/beta hydrolase family esterase